MQCPAPPHAVAGAPHGLHHAHHSHVGHSAGTHSMIQPPALLSMSSLSPLQPPLSFQHLQQQHHPHAHHHSHGQHLAAGHAATAPHGGAQTPPLFGMPHGCTPPNSGRLPGAPHGHVHRSHGFVHAPSHGHDACYAHEVAGSVAQQASHCCTAAPWGVASQEDVISGRVSALEVADLQRALDDSAAVARRQDQRLRQQKAFVRDMERQVEEIEQRASGVRQRVAAVGKDLESMGLVVSGQDQRVSTLEEDTAATTRSSREIKASELLPPAGADGKVMDGEVKGLLAGAERSLWQALRDLERRLNYEVDRRSIGHRELVASLEQGLQQLRAEQAKRASDVDDRIRAEQRRVKNWSSESQARHLELERRTDFLELQCDSLAKRCRLDTVWGSRSGQLHDHAADPSGLNGPSPSEASPRRRSNQESSAVSLWPSQQHHPAHQNSQHVEHQLRHHHHEHSQQHHVVHGHHLHRHHEQHGVPVAVQDAHAILGQPSACCHPFVGQQCVLPPPLQHAQQMQQQQPQQLPFLQRSIIPHDLATTQEARLEAATSPVARHALPDQQSGELDQTQSSQSHFLRRLEFLEARFADVDPHASDAHGSPTMLPDLSPMATQCYGGTPVGAAAQAWRASSPPPAARLRSAGQGWAGGGTLGDASSLMQLSASTDRAGGATPFTPPCTSGEGDERSLTPRAMS
mmetsp:Transcript_111705/g.322873  ORF Transcript_111705/g.322873 Transcript_111705/m.322873 type:complete len:689 (+) Transcript_111705:148-2214(+)